MALTAEQTLTRLRGLMADGGFDYGSVELRRPVPLSPEDETLANDLWRVAKGQSLRVERVERVANARELRTRVTIANRRA